MGDAPARFGATMGAGTFLPRIAMAELHARRGELNEANALLGWCIAEHPDVISVIAPYASVMLRTGALAETVATDIETRVANLTPAARFVLASTFFARGAMAAAERQYREILKSRPSSSQARVQLAETLLNQHKYEQAATEAAPIAEDDPFAGLASRIELWSLIASGAPAKAEAATGHAARAGVPSAELETFAGWIEVANGAPADELRALPWRRRRCSA